MEMILLNSSAKTMCCILITVLVFMPAFSPGNCGVFSVSASETGVLSGNKQLILNAKAVVLIEESSGRVLYSKNATEKRSIASTTKIMTALTALENGNLEDAVTVSKRAASIGGSTIGLRAGEKYTLKEMLYALLMISANDAAIAIAEHVGGTVENFAAMMNKRAASLGAADSNFVTPHGLDRGNQYSTAYDVALITREALKNPVFAEIVSTTSSSISGHNLYNTNELLGSYQGVDGVKTGYTGKAGRCLVTTAKRDGMRLISVVLGSPTRGARAEATRKLLDYGFDNFKMHRLRKSGEIYARVPVYRGVKGHVPLMVERDIVLPLTEDEVEIIKEKKLVPGVLNAPVYAGMESGFLEYRLNGEVLAQSALKVSENIRKKTYLDYLSTIFKSWCRMMRNGMFPGTWGGTCPPVPSAWCV
jgi:D-alanyl-D-alanine carboxypeptidase (penicillin-binding protein 5/6)